MSVSVAVIQLSDGGLDSGDITGWHLGCRAGWKDC